MHTNPATPVVRIHNWAQLKDGLFGNVEGHPTVEDGHRAFTSPIVGRDGDLVVTQSGTRYELVGEALFNFAPDGMSAEEFLEQLPPYQPEC